MRTVSCTLLSVALVCTASAPALAAEDAGRPSSTRPAVSAPAATPSVGAESRRSATVTDSALSPQDAAAKRPTLRYRSRGPAVVFVQEKLEVQPTSGYFGRLTRKAVRKFQRAHGMRATGTVGPRTWAFLLADGSPDTGVPTPGDAAAKRPTLRFGIEGPAVVYVQQFLSVSPTSGYFGPITRAAVKRYQTGMGISSTGVVGPITWAAVLAGKRPAPAPADPAPPEDPRTGDPTGVPHNATAAARAVAFAMAQVGERYVLGGNGPNVWDCSGLVQQAYLSVGVRLPRLASQQKNVGTRVSLSELQPGDLLYYQDGPSVRRGHISMYAGNGTAVEAANPRRGVRVRDLYEPWYAKRFVVATRVV
jgi:cell wall-associated NlpC family hydrolase